MEEERIQHVDKLKKSSRSVAPRIPEGFPFKPVSRLTYTLWLSEQKCNATNVQQLIDYIRKEDDKQSIHINTGTHGDDHGNNANDDPNKAEIKFFLEDFNAIKTDDNSSLLSVSSYTPPIYPVKANHIINAWCFSAKSSEDSYKSVVILQKRQVTDPIHGTISFPSVLWKFIDTPEFQRLRYLKQLGCLYYVFPGASHNRFEHSLGVCFLASQWMKHLQEQNLSLVENRDILLVQIAALCHDLGHGPFSHSFEKLAHAVIKRDGPTREWCHEEISCELLEQIHRRQSEKILTESDLSIVKSLILNSKKQYPESEEIKNLRDRKPFLWDIVAAKNGLDVDKMDYLLRDKFYCGVQTVSFEYTRIMQSSFIDKNGKLAFLEREAFNIFQVFNSRVLSYKKIYSHPVAMSVELMVNDILNNNQTYLNLSSIFKKESSWLNQFTLLTDAVLNELKRHGIDKDDLIERLQTRDLYTLVGQARMQKIHHNEEDTQELYESAKKHFPEPLYKIEMIKYDYGHRLDDPLTKILFGVPGNECKGLPRGVEDVSSLLPSGSRDQIIRIYYTGKKNTFLDDIITVFQQWAKDWNNLILESPKIKLRPYGVQSVPPSPMKK